LTLGPFIQLTYKFMALQFVHFMYTE